MLKSTKKHVSIKCTDRLDSAFCVFLLMSSPIYNDEKKIMGQKSQV